jgi:hypothetical protein
MFGFKKAGPSVCASLSRIAGITGAMGFALCGCRVRLRPRGCGQSWKLAVRDSRRIVRIGGTVHPLFNRRQTRRLCDKGRAAKPYQLVDLVPSRHGGSVCEVVCVCVVFFTVMTGSLVEGVTKLDRGIKRG